MAELRPVSPASLGGELYMGEFGMDERDRTCDSGRRALELLGGFVVNNERTRCCFVVELGK
jgi:hypothetical protein